MSADLSETEVERYSAQIEQIGVDAQLRLKAARSIVIGAGAAGSAAAAELASRGVGYVAVVDGAITSLGDLCAQSSLYTPDVGANRAEAVVAKLGVLNPNVQAEAYPVDVDDTNAAAIVMGHDVAIDCSGVSRESLGSACAEHGVELVAAEDVGTVAGALAAGFAIRHLVGHVTAAESVR